MKQTHPRPDQTAPAPEGFRHALAALVEVGATVAQLVGRMAEAEMALADAAAQAGVADAVPSMAGSLAEAIEADRAAAAAAEARQTVIARTEAIAAAFARISRAVRLTIMLAERLDRGWAWGRMSDDRDARAPRQNARDLEGAIEGDAEGERAERLETLDTETEIGDRPTQEIINEICRDLGLDPVRMTVRPPVQEPARFAEADAAAPFTLRTRSDCGMAWRAPPPQRRPDG